MREVLNDSLNETPQRSFLDFLETLGETLLPAQPAQVPLVFTLLANAPQDVTLPARSQVAAKLPPPAPQPGVAARPPDPPRFFTVKTVTLTRARLAAAYCVDPAADEAADFTERLTTGFRLFADYSPVPHGLYLGHDEFFALAGRAEVVLSFDMATVGADLSPHGLVLAWDYLSKDGWLPLTVIEDSTARFTRDGYLVLRKDCGPDAKEERLFGRTSYWLRARVEHRPPRAMVVETQNNARTLILDNATEFMPGDSVTIDGQAIAVITTLANNIAFLDRPLEATPGDRLRGADQRPMLGVEPADTQGPVPRVDMIRARVGFTKTGVAPEAAFADGVRLDTGRLFLPFGPEPRTFSTFHIGCKSLFMIF